MDKQIITFSANEQTLRKTGGLDIYASKTVSYIEAHFDLGDNWSGYDSIEAVWWTDFVKPVRTVLDTEGICIVPPEVLRRKGAVLVNLVGVIATGNVLTDRLTTAPITALTVKYDAQLGTGIKKGDIIGFTDPAYHTMVYMGKNSKGEPIFNTMGHTKGLSATYPYYASRKVNMIVRLKKV